ncbi:MAG: polysaccharide lyase family 7 protein, partial [Phycicoccus sp.]
GACTLDQPAAGIPAEITLFTVKSAVTKREDFCSVDKWYDETANKQVFSIFPGDDYADANPGSRSHARTEASGGLIFTRAEGTWHEFEADMLFNTLPPEGNDAVTVAQVFARCCGPVLRIEITDEGQLRWGSTDDGTGDFSEEGQSYAGKPFTLKMRSNGSQVEAYMDGKLRYSGSIRRFPGDEDTSYHFRWGVYSNTPPSKTLTNTVTNVRRS